MENKVMTKNYIGSSILANYFREIRLARCVE